MRSYTIDVSPVKIRVNEHDFLLQKSDGEAYRKVCEYLEHIQKSPKENNCIERFIAQGCELVDELLGNGACFQIFGSTPISLGHVASLCTRIAGDCLRAYRKYLKEEYLGAEHETI